MCHVEDVPRHVGKRAVVFGDRDEPEQCVDVLEAGTLERVERTERTEWRVMGRLVNRSPVEMALERGREFADVVNQCDDFGNLRDGRPGTRRRTLGSKIPDALYDVFLMVRQADRLVVVAVV